MDGIREFPLDVPMFLGNQQLGEVGTDDGRSPSKYVVGMVPAFHWMRDKTWVDHVCFEVNPEKDGQEKRSIG